LASWVHLSKILDPQACLLVGLFTYCPSPWKAESSPPQFPPLDPFRRTKNDRDPLPSLLHFGGAFFDLVSPSLALFLIDEVAALLLIVEIFFFFVARSLLGAAEDEQDSPLFSFNASWSEKRRAVFFFFSLSSFYA